MGLILLAVALAIAVGYLLGGRLDALGDLPVRRWAPLVAALVVQVTWTVAALAGADSRSPAVAALVVSSLLAAWFCAANLHVGGIPLAGLGLLLNLVVIVANGAMPVSQGAALLAGVPTDRNDIRHEPATDGTVLRPLGDVVAVPLPVRPEVLSVGDLLVAAGLVQFALAGMLWQAAPERGSAEDAGREAVPEPDVDQRPGSAGDPAPGPAGPRAPRRSWTANRSAARTGRRRGAADAGGPDDGRWNTGRDLLAGRAYRGRGRLVDTGGELVRVIIRTPDAAASQEGTGAPARPGPEGVGEPGEGPNPD